MKDIIAWFGFKRYPFDKQVKTSDLVNTEPLNECTARLDYMKQRCGIMLLTGDPGVGKTVSLRRFVENLNQNIYKPIYTPLSTLNRADILRHINRLLGLENRASKSANYLQIQKEFLESKEIRGKTIVLIIDESHLLKTGPLEELRLLTNFKMDSFDPFILILAGQSELRRIMEYSIMEPLAQRLTMRYHMPPLSIEETCQYIKNHLHLAGCPEPIFADDAMMAIHENSYGIPRKISNVAMSALTYAMFSEKRNIDADMVLKIKSDGKFTNI